MNIKIEILVHTVVPQAELCKNNVGTPTNIRLGKAEIRGLLDKYLAWHISSVAS